MWLERGRRGRQEIEFLSRKYFLFLCKRTETSSCCRRAKRWNEQTLTRWENKAKVSFVKHWKALLSPLLDLLFVKEKQNISENIFHFRTSFYCSQNSDSNKSSTASYTERISTQMAFQLSLDVRQSKRNSHSSAFSICFGGIKVFKTEIFGKSVWEIAHVSTIACLYYGINFWIFMLHMSGEKLSKSFLFSLFGARKGKEKVEKQIIFYGSTFAIDIMLVNNQACRLLRVILPRSR